MKNVDALISRVEALEGGLRHARQPLTEAREEVDSRLRERIRVRIGFLIDQELGELGKLRAQVGLTGEVTVGDWERLAEIKDACRPLFRECLALIEGTSTRRVELDRGLCGIADALLDDLSHRSDIQWGRFTILEIGESYGEMAEIIRLRFPQTTVWDLPVAAHEFGHFLAPRIQRRGSGRSGSPFLERLEKLAEPQERLFLHEHFADVLATVALGPAWAYTALLLRLDPFDEGGEDVRKNPASRHPPDDDRAQIILAALALLDDAEGGPYSGVADMLRQTWGDARQGAGRDVADGSAARESASDLVAIIVETLPCDLRFTPDAWLETDELMSALAVPGKAPELGDDMTLRHVLNATWRARLKGVESMPELERRSLELCTVLSAQGEPVAGGR